MPYFITQNHCWGNCSEIHLAFLPISTWEILLGDTMQLVEHGWEYIPVLITDRKIGLMSNTYLVLFTSGVVHAFSDHSFASISVYLYLHYQKFSQSKVLWWHIIIFHLSKGQRHKGKCHYIAYPSHHVHVAMFLCSASLCYEKKATLLWWHSYEGTGTRKKGW